MAKPLIKKDLILTEALLMLDELGLEKLSARNLATRLNCSTRTLYQQVGKRDDLVRELVSHFFTGFHLHFTPCQDWRDSGVAWAGALRNALLSHPNLARLITTQTRPAIAETVNLLLRDWLNKGLNEELALRGCRVLTHLVISLTLAEIEAPTLPERRQRRSSREIAFEDLVIARSGRDPQASFHDIPEVFENAVRWTLQGIEAEQGIIL
jgi:AcrR family transcriptional regulator